MISRFTARRLPDRIYKLLFVALLAIGQFGLVLHKLDFAHHADGKECSICLAAHDLDHALSACFMPPAVEAADESLGVPSPSLTASRTPLRRVARSPPIPALHA